MQYALVVLLIMMFVAAALAVIKGRDLLSAVLQSTACLMGIGVAVFEEDWDWPAWTLLALAVLPWAIYWGTRDDGAETE